MKKIIISVAPLSSDGRKLNIDKLIREIIECKRKGASMVHLHVINERGELTDKLDVFDRIVREVKQQEDIIIEGSTGGLSELNAKQRSVCLEHPLIEAASLNMGSVNIGDDVYVNKIPDIKWWAEIINKRNILPQLEIFDLSMIYTAERLIKEKLIKKNAVFNLCLGFESALPANPNILITMVQNIPQGRKWAFIHHGMKDLDLVGCAIGLGATIVRVGLEDAENKSGLSNIEWVERVTRLAKQMGKEIATPEEARKILGINRI